MGLTARHLAPRSKGVDAGLSRILKSWSSTSHVSPHVTTVRDADYVEYYVRYGPKEEKLWLKFMFGGLVGGHSPDDLGNAALKWTSQKFGCDGHEDGSDWRGVSADGRRWRHVSIPFGSAVYKNVPQKAANYFDKILNTMCCGKCTYCRK